MRLDIGSLAGVADLAATVWSVGGTAGPQRRAGPPPASAMRMLRGVGADLVGMSTGLEAIAACHLGVEVLAISLVTNPAAGQAARVGCLHGLHATGDLRVSSHGDE